MDGDAGFMDGADQERGLDSMKDAADLDFTRGWVAGDQDEGGSRADEREGEIAREFAEIGAPAASMASLTRAHLGVALDGFELFALFLGGHAEQVLDTEEARGEVDRAQSEASQGECAESGGDKLASDQQGRWPIGTGHVGQGFAMEEQEDECESENEHELEASPGCAREALRDID